MTNRENRRIGIFKATLMLPPRSKHRLERLRIASQAKTQEEVILKALLDFAQSLDIVIPTHEIDAGILVQKGFLRSEKVVPITFRRGALVVVLAIDADCNWPNELKLKSESDNFMQIFQKAVVAYEAKHL